MLLLPHTQNNESRFKAAYSRKMRNCVPLCIMLFASLFCTCFMFFNSFPASRISRSAGFHLNETLDAGITLWLQDLGLEKPEGVRACMKFRGRLGELAHAPVPTWEGESLQLKIPHLFMRALKKIHHADSFICAEIKKMGTTHFGRRWRKKFSNGVMLWTSGLSGAYSFAL